MKAREPNRRSAHCKGDDDLITATQAAKLLRVGLTDLMTATAAGQVPFHLRRGRVVFSRHELLLVLRRGGRPRQFAPATEDD